MSCQLTVETWWEDFKVITLENELIEVVLMPQRGGEIHQIRWKNNGFDFLCEGRPDMPDIRVPEPNTPLTPAENAAFSNFYTMFPNAGPQQSYLGYQYEFHGDIRSVGWEYQIWSNDEAKIILELKATCKELPFQLKRTVTLEHGSSSLDFKDELSHVGQVGGDRLPFIYGFHPYFSIPFLAQGTQFRVDGQTLFELPSREEAVSKLFSVETGPTGLVEVYNPTLKTTFRLKVDGAFLKHTWLWFVSRPDKNVYLGALIPCTNFISGQDGINAAIANDTALWLEPGQSRSSDWQIEVEAG